MSRLTDRVRDYYDGAIAPADLDEMLGELARLVLDAPRPIPGAPALVRAPGVPQDGVAAAILEEEIDRVARLISPAELERLCDQLAALLGALPPREPDHLDAGQRLTARAQVESLAMDSSATGGMSLDGFLDELGVPAEKLEMLDALQAPAAWDERARQKQDDALFDLALPDADEPAPAPIAAASMAGPPPPPAPAPASPASAAPPAPPRPPPAAGGLDGLAPLAGASAPPVAQRPAPAMRARLSVEPRAAEAFKRKDAPPPPAKAPPEEAPRAQLSRGAPVDQARERVARSTGDVPALHAGSTALVPAEPSRAVSTVVDGLVPVAVWVYVLRVAWLLLHGGALAGGGAWLVAAAAFVGRWERLRADRPAAAIGAGFGAVGCVVLWLLSLVR